MPWDAAFTEIGAGLQAFEPNSMVFYASGRAGLEAAYMYQLLARLYGTNNLPDSSNMCHETHIGGTAGEHRRAGRHRDTGRFRACDALFFFGQNVGINSPACSTSCRMREPRRADCHVQSTA